ncbi:hypothetical protein [Micromonospora tulbaghiae]|uniref:hypothetical protein n=1 Tax=Micromonospora tulbaghiae TaxID=479978 RepID=UPI0013C40D13|nr:hypothetical protein [Micromonospora tulbaghiae]
MRRRTAHKAAALSAATLLALAATPTAQAVASSAPADATTAAIEDYARLNNVGIDKATDAIHDQKNVVELISRTGVALGVDADVWIEQDSGGQILRVRTARKDVASAFAELRLSSLTTVSVVDATPISSRRPELTTQVEAAVRQVSPGVQGMYVRTADGALVIETTDSGSGSVAQAVKDRTGFPEVVLKHLQDAGGDSALTVRGGVAMTSCTAGFSAKNGSAIGYFSAAHCGQTQNIYPNTAGTGVWETSTRQAQNYGANADIAFYGVAVGTGNSISNTFYGSSSSSPTIVGGPQDVPEGITACHRGKTTGWKCGTITSIAYKPTWSGACPGTTCNSVFVRVSADQAGGDSGGPWVNGSNAIGIHKGGGSGWSVYSKIYRIPSGTTLYY